MCSLIPPYADTHTLTEHMEDLKSDKSLVESLVEEFYYTIRDRLEKDPEYDPEKYPSAHEFFKVRKWPGQQKEEDKKKGEAGDKDKDKKDKEAKTGQEGASTSSAAAMKEDNSN